MFTITPASHADIPETAAVLASAFVGDTVMSTLVHGDDRERRLTGLFAALMRSGALRTGRVDVARRDSDGLILGAAIWDAPAHRASLAAQLRELPGFVRALGVRGLVSAARLQGVLARHRPSEPHWYLAEIGVSEQARGAGVGSALLTSRLRKIDALEQPVYLESSNERNRALYRRHGFTRMRTIAGIASAAPAAMWREGRQNRVVAAGH